ncbi:hypothetical protein [Burkholderia pseudomallei]|uniref:hypothetical protein n=1 Tax=Burkholderia pseudomallei TaxID=28450 RepID=UPI00053872F5|nr:hypothetical protein [Burkholderia pseudomallei]KGX19053.1 hypothetical protein X896_790 [Burkholderia pseudomallei ABCPW 1]
MAEFQIASGAATYAAKEIIGTERSAITRAYSAIVALCLRDDNHGARGYAARLIDVLSEQIAEQRAGKKWADMGAADRVSATRAAFPTAKRYAEKSVGIAKQAADKGAPVTEIANAEKDEDAAGIVRAWLLGMGCTSQDALFAAFGFAKAAGKREPKGATAKTPSEVTSSTPEAPASDAQPAQTPAAEVNEADNRSVADVSRENAARFAESVRAVMAGMTDADRQFFAQTILADVQAAAALNIAVAETETVAA